MIPPWRLRRHKSVSWDRFGKCRQAICRRCGKVRAVSAAGNTQGRMVAHGPLGRDGKPSCPGGGGLTTKPQRRAAKAGQVGNPNRRR